MLNLQKVLVIGGDDMNVSFSVKKIEDISKEVILFEDGEMISNFLGIIVDKKNMEEIIESLIPGIIPEIVDDEIITVKETMKLLNVSYKTLNKLNLKPVNINGKQRKYRKKDVVNLINGDNIND